MLQIVATGRLATEPKLETVGRYQVLKARLAVNAPDGTTFLNCSFFQNRFGAILSKARVGTAMTVAGEGRIGAYQTREGEAAPSVDLDVSSLDLHLPSAGAQTPAGANQAWARGAATVPPVADDDNDLPF